MDILSEIISYGHIENKLMYPHRNPGMEIVLVERGHLEWAVENIPEILNPGMVFFTLPWQAHGSLHVREPRNKIYYTLFALDQPYEEPTEGICMPPALGFSSSEEEMLARVFTSSQRHAWPASDLLKAMFPELIQRLDRASTVDQAGARALLRTIIVELANIISNAPLAQQFVSPTIQRVRTFLKSLPQCMDQPWRLDKMAEDCGVKRTQFAKITKQLTGYPPTQYLNRIRFKRACELLRNSDMSITDIAFECGYNTSQYFTETFKKNARITPSEYRRHLPDLNAIMRVNWNYPERRSIADEHQRASRFRKKK